MEGGNQNIQVDLSEANLNSEYLFGANLQGATLNNINLRGAHLWRIKIARLDLLCANMGL
ncbi:MAG: pentapeptide repeat-containing protein [Saprospirales bacterium]|nr:pentapeptide repeat-containing protein [Saprospirales bacterium]